RDGEVIPDARVFRELEDDMCLVEAEKGEFTIRKVINASPELLAYLNKQSLVPTQTFTLLQKAPFLGPLKLQIHGRAAVSYIGHEVADCIFVSPIHNRKKRPPIVKQRAFGAGPPRKRRARN